jgi:Flp pilus assembly CpaE family ATPase
MDGAATVVLALEAARVAEEVLHYLDRSGLARVVGTASDDRQLADAARQLEPDVIVAHPTWVGAVRELPVLALDTRESIGGLRAAIDGGARGFFVWPDDRERLLGTLARSGARAAAGEVGSIVAVRGARGGAGQTFVAVHLAAALARAGRTCVLVDADPLPGDLTAALGAPQDGVRTLADLVPLAGELGPHQVEEALWSHGAGFRVLLASEPEVRVTGQLLGSAIDAAARIAEVVLVHLPRSIDDRTLPMLGTAGRVLHVLTLDPMSFRAADRALQALSPLRPQARPAFVVNRAARSEIVPGDVRRVFGADPLAVIPVDRAIATAMAKGRLVGPRGRVPRAFDRAAAALLDDPREEAA